MRPGGSIHAGWGAVLLLIAVAGIALRFVGLSWGLPYDLHPDEPIILSVVEHMSWSNLNPGFFIYPGFFVYQVFLLAQVLGRAGADNADLVYAARILSALYGVATIVFVYALGGRLGGRRVGTVAAGLFAVMGAATLHAHYAVTDTPVAAMATAAVWLSVRSWQRQSYRGLAAAAALAGLAVSTKYSAAPVCFAPWVGFMALSARDAAPITKRVMGTALLAAAAVSAFLVTSPFTVLDAEGFARDMVVESRLQSEARPGQHIAALDSPTWSQRGLAENPRAMWTDMGGVGFVLALSCLLVVSLAWVGILPARRTPGAFAETTPWDGVGWAMALTWVVLFFALMAPSALGGQRYMLPVYPVLMVFTAGAIELAWRALPLPATPIAVTAWFGTCFALVALSPAGDAVMTTRILAQRDTRLVARDWIIDNIPAGSHLARDFYGPPFNSGDGFRLSQPFSLTEHPITTYCNEGVDYLLLSSLNAERYFADDGARFATERAWYERLDDRTRIVERFEGRDLELHHPTIEIRRVFCDPGQTQ